MAIVCESVLEDAALDWFRALGYVVEGGPDVSPTPDWVRYSVWPRHADVLLANAVGGALRRPNAELPEQVPIYYESRIAELTLDEREWPKVVLRPTYPSDGEVVRCAATSDTAIDSLAQLGDGGAYRAVNSIAVLDTPVGLPNARVRLVSSSCAAPVAESISSEPARGSFTGCASDALVGPGGSPRGAAGASDRVMLGAGDELVTHRSVAIASGATPRDRVGAMEGWSPFLGLSPSGGV